MGIAHDRDRTKGHRHGIARGVAAGVVAAALTVALTVAIIAWTISGRADESADEITGVWTSVNNPIESITIQKDATGLLVTHSPGERRESYELSHGGAYMTPDRNSALAHSRDVLVKSTSGKEITFYLRDRAEALQISQALRCQKNLSDIQAAIEFWAGEEKRNKAASVTWDDLKPLLGKRPTCPAGYEYEISVEGEEPKCTSRQDLHSLKGFHEEFGGTHWVNTANPGEEISILEDVGSFQILRAPVGTHESILVDLGDGALLELGTEVVWKTTSRGEFMRIEQGEPTKKYLRKGSKELALVQAGACQQNLLKLKAAMDQWVLEKNLSDTDAIQSTDLKSYLRGASPICPSGHPYKISSAAEGPVCESGEPGHSLREIGAEFQPRESDEVIQTKVSRVKADMRSLATAIESYYVDNNLYPSYTHDQGDGVDAWLRDENPRADWRVPTFERADVMLARAGDSGGGFNAGATLTTPVAYLTRLFSDPFATPEGRGFAFCKPHGPGITPQMADSGWIVWSAGPDGKYDILDPDSSLYNPAEPIPSERLLRLIYDPTNGIRSAGDIVRLKQ